MPRLSKVGSGWGGSEDYATLALWWSAEAGVDYGAPIEAMCLGTASVNTTLSGSSVNGAIIYTDSVEYDGSNEIDLAIIDRLTLQAPVTLRDMLITSTNQFVAAFMVDDLSDGSVLERLRVASVLWNGVDAISTTGSSPNSIMRNSVVSGGVNCFDFGFNQQLPCENVVAFGADGDGFEGSGNVNPVINCFAFSNGANDYVNVVLTNSASEDGTGNITGYTSAEMVDFAGNDFRIKQSSDLHPLNIGAFFESGSGELEIDVPSIPSAESFGTPTVQLNDQFINTPSISSSEAVEEPTVIAEGVSIFPIGISSEESVGEPVLQYPLIISVDSIESEEAFGIAIVSDGNSVIIPVADRGTYQKIYNYLDSTGRFTSNQCNDMIKEWLTYEGIEYESFNGAFKEYWKREGYVGAYNDQWKKWKGDV